MVAMQSFLFLCAEQIKFIFCVTPKLKASVLLMYIKSVTSQVESKPLQIFGFSRSFQIRRLTLARYCWIVVRCERVRLACKNQASSEYNLSRPSFRFTIDRARLGLRLSLVSDIRLRFFFQQVFKPLGKSRASCRLVLLKA